MMMIIYYYDSYKDSFKPKLMSASMAVSQTPTYNLARAELQDCCIKWCIWLHTSFHWYSVYLPTEGWPGWVDLDCL